MKRCSLWLLGLLVGCFDAPSKGPGVYCADRSECAGNPEYPVCDPISHQCVAADAGVAAACERDSDCVDPETPVCSRVHDACVPCTDASDDGACLAHGGGLKVCIKETGRCGACRAATDCTMATAPVCDAASCRRCLAQGECAGSVCYEDGSCAPESDVAWVDNQRCMAGMRTGARDQPYCEIADAVVGLGQRKAIRVVGSPQAYLGFDTARATSRLLVVGPGRSARPAATIRQPGAICVDVGQDKELQLDGFDIAGCKGGGVRSIAAKSLTLLRSEIHDVEDGPAVSLNGNVAMVHRLDGLIIRNNVAGGAIALHGVAYDIRNCFIYKNLGTVGGISIDVLSTGRFAFNTVLDNTSTSSSYAGGVECTPLFDRKVPIESSIFLGNTTNAGGTQFGPACVFNNVVAGRNDLSMATGLIKELPVFVGPGDYRLQGKPANAQIIDVLDDLKNTTDIDGTSRPQGQLSDIGCYEVK